MLKDRDFSEMFIQTLEQAIDSVVVIDAKNRVIFFNKAAEQLWGYSREEIIGNNVRVLVPPDIQPHHDGYVDTNRHTGINRIVGTFRTVPIHRKDGSKRWGSMSISKVKSGDDIIYTAFVKDVTVQYEKEEHTRLLSLVANVTDSATIITDAAWNIVYVNDGFTRTFGYTFDEVKGKNPLTVLMPHIESDAIARIRDRLAHGHASNSEELTYSSTGERMWSTIVTNPVMNDAGQLINTVSVLTDITYSKMYEVLQNRVLTAMAHEQPLENIMLLICNELERILPDFYIAVLRVEEQQTLSVLASPSFPQRYNQVIEGIKIGPAVGSCGTAAYRGEDVSVSDIHTDPLWVDFQELAQTLDASSCWSVPIKNNNDRVLGVMAFYHQQNHTPSESERKLVEIAIPLCTLALEREESRAHIRQLAFYDSLTGLPNRSLLHAEAERALLDAQKHKHTMAVFFFDLDRFKQVNDSLGHPAGDSLLQVVAERLTTIGQQADHRKYNTIVGRLSGDEFVLVLPQCDPAYLTEFVDLLRNTIMQPCEVGGMAVAPSTSIGISLFPQDGHDIGTLIHRADMAMYQAKSAGRGRYSFFSHELNQLVQERQALESALRDALKHKTLELHYQPQIRMQDGYLYGVEALARWHHPEFGQVSPARFVALAEESGLMNELGQWAIKEACAQLAKWRQQGVAIPAVSVNLSPTSFHNLDLPGMIAHTLKEHALTPSDLTLEITENILVDTNPAIMKTIAEVHAQGIRLSMDDFGTGYSSLSYLRRLPIQELKLDRSFVKDLESDHTSRALSDAVIRIGESLQLTVVAEGIETDDQHQILKQQGYHVGQGYLFSRAMKAEELAGWLIEAEAIPKKLVNE